MVISVSLCVSIWQRLGQDVLGMFDLLSLIGFHVQRILRPTDTLVRHPVEHQVFQKEKKLIYEKSKAMESITRSIPTLYTGPMPHTPEFSKLLPDLEGLMFRRDPFHEWGVIQLSLVSTFLVIRPTSDNQDEDSAESFLFTESLIPLLEETIDIKLLSVNRYPVSTQRGGYYLS